jgi:hypothetical protein
MSTELLISSVVGLLAAIIGAVVIIAGWAITHRKDLERQQSSKRREIIVGFLIDAYRRLEYEGSRDAGRGPRGKAEIEKTFADIQLFGSASLVSLAQDTARTWANTSEANLTPLLEELRQQLRAELGLAAVPRKALQFRLQDGAYYESDRHAIGPESNA